MCACEMPIYQIHGTCIHGNMEICVYEHMIRVQYIAAAKIIITTRTKKTFASACQLKPASSRFRFMIKIKFPCVD